MRSPVLVALLLLAIPALARADAISPPPEDCARGAIGRSSHAGTWCDPTTCTGDASCQAEYEHAYYEVRTWICAPAGLCVRDEEYEPGGRRAIEDTTRLRRTVALGPCASQADCPSDTRCESAARCVQPSLPELAARQAGCSCAVAPRAPLPLWGLLLALVQLGVWGRRAPRTRA